MAAAVLTGVSAGLVWPKDAKALGETRTISLHNNHTKEDITITFKRDGKIDQAALDKINWFMRDFRQEEKIRMDPKLIDLLWELHRELGSKKPIHLISGYRSPKTNAMLKRRGRNVATRSRHMVGQAADVYFPDVPVKRLRELALIHQRGGVGFYPRSGKYGFVHIDTGNVRHWPRMAPQAYAKLMKKRDTVLASLRSKHKQSGPLQIASLESASAKPVAATAASSGIRGDADLRSGNSPAAAKLTLTELIKRELGFGAPETPAREVQTAKADLPAAAAKADASNSGSGKSDASGRALPTPRAKPTQVLELAASLNGAGDGETRKVASLTPMPVDPVTTAAIPQLARVAVKPRASMPGVRSGPQPPTGKSDRLDHSVASGPAPASSAVSPPITLPTHRLIINRNSKGNLMMTRGPRYAQTAAYMQALRKEMLP